MLLSDEFGIGRVNARETAERNREIEMARQVREEKARRRTVASPADAVVAGAESLLRARADHPAGTRRSDIDEQASRGIDEQASSGTDEQASSGRELQSAGN
jgi:hypothetical protein